MLYLGQCLTLGLVPVALTGHIINTLNAQNGKPPPFPWPIFGAVLFCLLAVGIGMLRRRHNLLQRCDPNEEDVEARKLYGQSRATLVSEQDAKDILAHTGANSPSPSPDSAGGTGKASNVAREQPPANVSAGENVAACIVGLLFIIGGICYWNYWRAEKAKEEARKFNPYIMQYDRAIVDEQLRDSQRRIQEGAKALEDMMRFQQQNQNRPPFR
jgi:hypothetical protein